MAGKIPLQNLSMELERRIALKLSKFEPKSPELNAALYRIGFLIESEAKLNVRRLGIIDTGRLLNSIQTRLYTQGTKVGVTVGSFGVPYAAINEFGGPFTDLQRRAMFSALRDRGKLGNNKGGKGVIRGGQYIKRPYLQPAVRKHKLRIIEIIRGLLR